MSWISASSRNPNRWRQAALSGAAVLILGAGVGACKPDAGSDTATASGWKEYDVTDKMDPNKKGFDAETTLTADDGESFDLKVECAPGFVNFTLDDYAKGAKIELGKAQNGDDAVFLQTRLDDAEVMNPRSDSQYNNEASIFFYDPDIAPRSIADGVGGAYGRVLNTSDSGSNPTGNAAAGLAGALTGLLSGPMLRATGAGTIKDLVAASTLKIEVPMTDARKPMLTIALKDPALRDFFGRCQRQTEARYPPKPPESAAPTTATAATIPDSGTQPSAAPAIPSARAARPSTENPNASSARPTSGQPASSWSFSGGVARPIGASPDGVQTSGGPRP